MKVKHAPTPTHSHTGTLPIHNVTRLFSMVTGTEATPPFSETGGKDRGHASFLWDWQKRYRGHASFHWDWNESLILSELFCCRCLCFACLFICVWSLVAVQFLTFTSDWPISGRNAWKAIKPRQIVETIWQPTSVTSTSHTHTVQDGRGERESAQPDFFLHTRTNVWKRYECRDKRENWKILMKDKVQVSEEMLYKLLYKRDKKTREKGAEREKRLQGVMDERMNWCKKENEECVWEL